MKSQLTTIRFLVRGALPAIFSFLTLGMCISIAVAAESKSENLEAKAAFTPLASNSIDTMVVNQQSGNTVITVGVKAPLNSVPANFSVTTPPRVVFDFPGVSNGSGRAAQTVNEGDLRSINLVQVGDRTRLVLNLRKPTTFQTNLSDNLFVITLVPSGSEYSSVSPVSHFDGTPSIGAKRTVRDIRFRRGKLGEGLISVDLSDPNTPVDVRQQGNGLVVDLQQVGISDEQKRKLDVTDFATPVSTVTTSRTGDNVRISIGALGLWEHTAYQSDNQFVIEVKPLKEDPSKLFQGSQRQGYQGDKVSLNFQNIPLRELLHVFADITNFNIVVSDSVSGNVSLRLNEVPWDQALEIVLKQKGLAMRKNGNVLWIAPGDELAAREKLELESQLAIADLEPVRTESFQLNYQKADVVDRMLKGISTVTGGQGSSAPQPTQPTTVGGKVVTSRVLSDRGSSIFDQRTNKLFVSDTPTKLAEIRKLVQEIDVPVRQVLIEARIVEADDTFSKSLGARIGGSDNKGLTTGNTISGVNNLRWGVAASTSDTNRQVPYYPINLSYPPQYSAFTTNYVPSGRITDIDKTGKVTFERASPSDTQIFKDQQFVNLPASNAAGQFVLSLFSKGMAQLLTFEISAMEADGKGKTISSPRVLTADQKEAIIESGERAPYPAATSSGATAIAFASAVLSLKVTPQITPDGRVIMKLAINKDALGALGPWGYNVSTKNISTDVLVENGGTVVIGGIYVQDEGNSVTKVPLLGDIPVFGNMFKKTDKTFNRRELLVFVSPKIVSESLSAK